MMVSIINNDMDLATNHNSVSEPEQIRVSNDESISEEIRVSNDLNSSEEIRVSSGHDLGTRKGSRVMPGRGHEGQEGEDDDARVLDEMNCRSNGDSGFDDDVEIEFREASNIDGVSDVNVRDRSVSNNGVKMDGADRCGELPNSGSTDLVASRAMRIMGSGFEMGDMVWGKVKSHPWWPGHIFNETFVSSIVRRTRKDGLVLVAFFGDSSYGWFDPLELIPYDPHYAEKSQQTTSRSFIRAVEDSVDETSRRSALGLSCRCRNPYNFRPTHVPGYMAVDVVDYEPGAIYSVSQIQRARESFQPSQALTFIKELAAAPRSDESKSLEFIKQKASVLAYRRSRFEEFDETYAQAFGQEPVRPSQSPQKQVDKEPFRAPLSGPLVVAESLGGRKSSTKATKPKDLSNKKDRYLFKRRDEAGDLRTARISQVHASSSSSSANEDGTSDSAAASYVLQKRDHSIPTNSDLGGAPTMDQVETSAHHITTKDAPPAGLGVTIGSDISAKKLSLDATSGSRQLESSAAMTADVSDVHDQVPDRHTSSIISTDGGLIKKKKIVKRPAGERSSEKPDISEKRMKKLRKTDGERSMEHPERLLSGSGENMVKSAGRPMQITAAGREDLQLSNRKKEAEVINSVPHQAASLEAVEENEVEVPQMLADLHGLALNPFHGAERSRSVIARQFFLKFRSLVFLKASSASSMAESEPGESRAIRSPSAAEPTDKPEIEGSKAVTSLKPSKLSARHEESAKLGRKRLPSERQEEIAAKKAKKITEVKSLGAEKRALVKNSEMLRPDGKTKVAVSQQPSSKPLKPEHHTKKPDGPPRVEEPTYLIMRFQAGSSLPSLVELKARFTRFGPLDIPLSRVFYKTNTCRVAFLYKQDAHVAYRYAVGSKSLFSNVKFMLKPVAATEPQHPSTGKTEELHGDPSSNRDSSAVEPRTAVPPTALMQQQAVQQQQQQLKSCLKKPSGGDEPAGPTNGSGAVRTSRVRFNMGEDKGVAGNKEGVVSVQMESRNAILSSEGLSCSSSSSSSVAMDVINNQRFMSSLPLQPLPLPHLPPQFPRPPINNPQHHVELAPRNNYNHNLTVTTGSPGPAPPVLAPPTQGQGQASARPPPSIDISQQMMSLLTRCHDVVTNVRNILGYEPYHPL